MSRRTDFACAKLAATAIAIASAFNAASAQTLADLADAQRTKQQAEILKAKKDLEAAEVATGKKPELGAPALSADAARAAARQAEEAARPKVVVHALYEKKGIWIAELASNQRLAVALIGMQIYGFRVTGIGQQGVTVFKPCNAQDVRDKARCGKRVLAVGEAV